MPADGTLQTSYGFSNTPDLFKALEDGAPSNLKRLGDVYSYADGPSPPLSRDFLVVGFADTALSVVRKLVGDDDDDTPPCLQKCLISSKRMDGSYAKSLRPKDMENSKAFSLFMRRLKKEDVVAIIAKDKYERFGILKPSESIHPEGELTADDFFGICYVGRVEPIKDFLAKGIRAVVDEAIVDESSVLWKPTGVMATNNGLWQPPGNNEDTGADPFSWKPPDGHTNGLSSGNDFEATFQNTWDTVESGVGNVLSTKRKRKDNEEHGGANNENDFHSNAGAAAADEFYSKLTRSLDTRAESRLFHMRSFNGWVKATQIQELDPRTKPDRGKAGGPMRVLDLACGKGGDLGKWVLHARGISNYVGSDVARGSLRDAAVRARQIRQKLKRCTFICADLGSDVPGRLKSPNSKYMQKLSMWSLQDESEHETGTPEFRMLRGGGIASNEKFDVISIQFAIHYMMQTKQRAQRFFETVSQLLEIGGNLIATTIDARVVIAHLMNLGLDLHFDESRNSTMDQEAIIEVGGGACRIQFEPKVVKRIFQSQADSSTCVDDLFGLEYSFTLVEGSDHAAGVGNAVNLPEWLTPIPALKCLAAEAGLELEYVQNFHEFFAIRNDPNTHTAAHSALYNMKVLNRNGSLSTEEWEISHLYCAVKFRKVSESTMKLDDIVEEAEEEDEIAPLRLKQIDPLVKAKLMPIAMREAKQNIGNEAWLKLSAEEKKHIVDVSIEKLVLECG